MGIKNLNKFIKTQAPHIYIPLNLSQLAYKKIAIDISLYLFKYKAICGNNWLSAFINLISALRRNDIHCVFIYDGIAPPEKQREKDKRRLEREKLEKYVHELEYALDQYHLTQILPQILIDLHSRRRSPPPPRLLSQSTQTPGSPDIPWIENKIQQKRNQIIQITPQDLSLTKELFNILKVPHLTAPQEAEKYCSKLCIDGLVDAVLSEDSDVIAYGAPVFLSHIDTQNDTIQLLETQTLRDHLSLTQSQLLDLCIMCGTDYNNNIPKIGPHNALKLITKHHSIENIPQLDTSVLNYIRVRELFTSFTNYYLPKPLSYCGTPDWNALESFTANHSLSLNPKKIQKFFTKDIIFIED
jgi:5'-3' exonuclease